MSEPAAQEPNDDAGAWWQERLWLVALCVGALAVGLLARAYYIAPVEADLSGIERVIRDTRAADNAILARYDARKIDRNGLADAIERQTLPHWSAALTRAETLKSRGIEGEALDDLIRFLRLRRDAAEQLVDAIKTNDAELYERAKQTHREAEAAGAVIDSKGGRRAPAGKK